MNPVEVENIPAEWVIRWSMFAKAEAAKRVKEKQMSEGNHTYTTEETELLWWLRNE